MTRPSLILPILMTVACSTSNGSESSSSLTADDYDDAAQAIAASSAGDGGGGGDLGAMSDATTIATGGVPLGFTLVGDGELDGNILGLAYHYSVTCDDAAGNQLAECSAATDHAKVDVAWSGHLDTTHLDASVDRTGSWTIDGLQSNAITFAGASTLSYDATLRSIFRPGAQTSLSFHAATDYDAVVIDSVTHDAVDGRVVFDLHAHKVVTGTNADVDKSFSVHAELQLHADRTATLTLDDNYRYTLDLATGALVRI